MSKSRESSLGSVAMEEEEDDLYGTGPTTNAQTERNAPTTEDLEEGEEEEEEDESDIEIVTERPDLGPEPTTASRTGPKAAGTSQHPISTATPSQQEAARAVPTTIRIASDTNATPQAVAKPILLPGDKYPAIRTTTAADLDLENIPLWNGKPITELDIDADLAEQMKPWRRPGADQSDYFNYGFDEFSWAMYCEKQKVMRGGIEEQKNENKMFEQMMGMPGMPGMPGAGGGSHSPMPGGGGGGGGAGGGGGIPGMPSEQDMMQMTMQYMQANGITDISQVDFGAVMQQFGQMGGGAGVPTGPSGGGQQGGWGGQQGGYGGGGGGRRGRGRW